MKYIARSLVLSGVIARQMKTNDHHRLEKIRDRLLDRIGLPFGWHMFGIPLVAGMFFTMMSFALAQLYLWLLIFDALGLPKHTVMAGTVAASLVYTPLLMLPMFLVARGNYRALKLFLTMLVFSGLVSVINFIAVCLSVILDTGQEKGFIVAAILSLLLIIAGVRSINSRAFYRANALFLHNRVWRKELDIQQAMVKTMKRGKLASSDSDSSN